MVLDLTMDSHLLELALDSDSLNGIQRSYILCIHNPHYLYKQVDSRHLKDHTLLLAYDQPGNTHVPCTL